MSAKRVGFLAFSLMLVMASQAEAQDEPQPQEVRFISNGQPLARVQVSGFLNGINKGIDETGADGEITIPVDALNTINKGTEVAVWIVTCDGVVTQVLLIRVEDEDGDNPSKHDQPDAAHVGEDCECERAGVFVWGDGPVTVDVTTGTVSQAPTDELDVAEMDDGGWSGYLIPFFKANRFDEVEFESGNVAGSTWSSGGGINAGLRLGNHLWAMVGGHILNVDRDIAVDGDSRNIDYDAYYAGAGLRYYPITRPRARVHPFLALLAYHTWNKGDFDIDGGEIDHRVHKSWRYELGGGLTSWFSDRVGVDLGVGYSPAVKGDDDADAGWDISTGLIFNVGTPCGGQCGGRR